MRILFPMLFINMAYFRTPESKIIKKITISQKLIG